MITLPAAAVRPTMTVLLLQGQVPCTILLNHLCCRQLQYRATHYLGAGVLALALFLCLLPLIVDQVSHPAEVNI